GRRSTTGPQYTKLLEIRPPSRLRHRPSALTTSEHSRHYSSDWPPSHEPVGPRPKTLELLQHPPRRWAFLWRLRRAVDVPLVPEDGGRAVPPAPQQALRGPQGVQLAGAAQTGWR